MQKVRFITLALASMAALAACSDNPAGPAPDAITVKPVTARAVTNVTVCSDATTAPLGGWFLYTSPDQNPNWIAPLADSKYIGPTLDFTSPDGTHHQSDFDFTRNSMTTFSTSFSTPPGSTGISIAGHLFVDNGVTVRLNGTAIQSYGLGPYVVNQEDPSTYPDFNPLLAPAGGQPFSASGLAAGSNTVSFDVFNDDYPNFGQLDSHGQPSTGNPMGLDFCYTVSYTPFVPPSGGQGCTLGYWKNHTSKWTTYSPSQSFASVFGATHNPYGTKSLLAVLQTGGGGIINLGRQTVAALLNASSGISFGETTAQVIADFQAVYPGTGTAKQIAAAQDALATKFENMTDAVATNVCPLN